MPPPTPDTLLGVQMFGQDIQPPIVDPLAGAGLRWTRVPVLWSVLEPIDTDPRSYNWDYVDNMLTPLVEDGLTPIVTLYNNPSWAATTACGAVDLVPLARYEEMLSAFVERYDGDGVDDAPRSPVVRHFEISNEQDFSPANSGGQGDHGGCFGDDPAGYGTHLRAAYRAAKGASGEVVVIFGGVAYERFYNLQGYNGPLGPFNYDFTGDTLAWLQQNHGGEPEWPFFDWMALHIYNDYRNQWDGSQPFDQEIIGKVKHFKANQLRRDTVFDLRSVPIAISEVSLPSAPSDSFTNRSESLQAAYPARVAARAAAIGVENIVWFSAEDSFTGPCDDPFSWLTFGMLRSTTVAAAAGACDPNPLPGYNPSAPHEPKPVVDAVTTTTNQLGGASFQAQLFPFFTGSNQIEAYRFTRPDGGYTVVAFTDNGERLGRVGYPPLTKQMTFSALTLPDWTGAIAVTDHLGATSTYSGTSIPVTLTQWPKFVRAVPAAGPLAKAGGGGWLWGR